MEHLVENIKKKIEGFTMLEVVIVLGVIAILAGLITPLAINTIQQSRINSCWDEIHILKSSIVGDAALVESGSRSSFGYMGDLGALPRDNLGSLGLGTNNRLGDLITQNGLTGTNLHASGITWGWRGPYINEYVDPWGRDYVYTTATGNPMIAARIWSYGADGIDSTGDEISITIRTDEIYSRISGNTLDSNGAGIACTVAFYAPDGLGVQTYNIVPSPTATTPFYSSGANVYPIGIRKIVFTTATGPNSYFFTINNGPVTTLNFREP